METTNRSAARILSVHNVVSHTNVPVENFLQIDPGLFSLEILSFHQDQQEVDQFIRTVYPYRPVRVHGLGWSAGGMRRLLQVVPTLRRIRPDVVHLNHTLSAAIFAAAARLFTSARIILTIHRDFRTLRPSQRLLMLAAMALSDMVVCNSQSTLNSLGKWRRRWAGRKRFDVCYNGVNLHDVTLAVESRPRDTLADAQGRFVVGFVGRLCSVKDVATLVRAFAHFLHLRSNSVLVVAGDGPERQRLESLARRLHVEQHVRFVGEITRREVYDLLTRLDVFAVSSRSEGFCNSMVEAMAAGKAVVATKIDVLEEILGPECGYFFDAGNDEQLAARLVALHDDDAARRRLGAAAQSRARERYGIDVCADQYSRLYRELLPSQKDDRRPDGVKKVA